MSPALSARRTSLLPNGASLTGTGSIGGSVVIQTGGNISSGSGGAGTLAIGGGLTLNGTPLTFDLNNSTTPGGGVNDLYTIGGALTLNGTITVTPNLLNGPLAAGTYTLISGGTSTVNNATFVWGGAPERRPPERRLRYQRARHPATHRHRHALRLALLERHSRHHLGLR